MPAWLAPLLPLAALSALLSGAITVLVASAGRRRLADQPGRHRLHDVPTPRGGGLGIALVCTAALIATAVVSEAPWWRAWAAPAALLAVAAVGLLDDWRNLPIGPRLLVQLAAAVAVALAAIDVTWSPGGLPAAAAVPLLALALLWSINLHNFMDGSNGLLALQACFVFAVIAVFAMLAPAPRAAALALVACPATLAFLPYNLPHARVFLGDVGSGALGLLVGLVLIAALRERALPLPAALLLPSVFVVDATLTLFSRALRGRRWYARHREHLYQWLIRAGASHARVALSYLAFNLGVVLPALLGMRLLTPASRWTLALAVLAGEVALWFVLKRRILAALRKTTA